MPRQEAWFAQTGAWFAQIRGVVCLDAKNTSWDLETSEALLLLAEMKCMMGNLAAHVSDPEGSV